MPEITHAEIARYPVSLQSAARAVFGTPPAPPRTLLHRRLRDCPNDRPQS